MPALPLMEMALLSTSFQVPAVDDDIIVFFSYKLNVPSLKNSIVLPLVLFHLATRGDRPAQPIRSSNSKPYANIRYLYMQRVY